LNISFSTTSNRRILILASRTPRNVERVMALESIRAQAYEKLLINLQEDDPENVVFHGASTLLADFLSCDFKISLPEYIVCDSSSEKSKRLFLGHKVHQPSLDLANKVQYVVCFSSYTEQIDECWRTLGFKGTFISMWS
jgi:hypothetical protein